MLINSGGFNKEKHVLSSVLRFEFVLDKWVKVSSMKTPRARHGKFGHIGHS